MANTSCRSPAAALPSSRSGSISTSRRAEALGLDAERIVAELHERLRDRLHERRRAADERQGEPAGRDLGEQLAVDAPRVARPALGLLAGQRVDDVEPVPAQLRELVSV